MKHFLISLSLLVFGTLSCQTQQKKQPHKVSTINHYHGVGKPNQYCTSFDLFDRLDPVADIQSLAVDSVELSCINIFSGKVSICRPTISTNATAASPIPDAFVAKLCSQNRIDCETKAVGGSGQFSFLPKSGSLIASVKSCVTKDRAPEGAQVTDTVNGTDYYCGNAKSSKELTVPDFSHSQVSKDMVALVDSIEGVNGSISGRADKLWEQLNTLTQVCRDTPENASCGDNQMMALTSLVNMGKQNFIDTVHASYGQNPSSGMQQAGLQLASGSNKDYCAAVGADDTQSSSATSNILIPPTLKVPTLTPTQPAPTNMTPIPPPVVVTQTGPTDSGTATQPTTTTTTTTKNNPQWLIYGLYIVGGALMIASGAYAIAQGRLYKNSSFGSEVSSTPSGKVEVLPPEMSLPVKPNGILIAAATNVNATRIQEADTKVTSAQAALDDFLAGNPTFDVAHNTGSGPSAQNKLYKEYQALAESLTAAKLARQTQVSDFSDARVDQAFQDRLKVIRHLQEAQDLQKYSAKRVAELDKEISDLEGKIGKAEDRVINGEYQASPEFAKNELRQKLNERAQLKSRPYELLEKAFEENRNLPEGYKIKGLAQTVEVEVERPLMKDGKPVMRASETAKERATDANGSVIRKDADGNTFATRKIKDDNFIDVTFPDGKKLAVKVNANGEATYKWIPDSNTLVVVATDSDSKAVRFRVDNKDVLAFDPVQGKINLPAKLDPVMVPKMEPVMVKTMVPDDVFADGNLFKPVSQEVPIIGKDGKVLRTETRVDPMGKIELADVLTKEMKQSVDDILPRLGSSNVAVLKPEPLAEAPVRIPTTEITGANEKVSGFDNEESGVKFNKTGLLVAGGGFLAGAAMVVAAGMLQNQSNTNLAESPQGQALGDAAQELAKLFDQKAALEDQLLNAAKGN